MTHPRQRRRRRAPHTERWYGDATATRRRFRHCRRRYSGRSGHLDDFRHDVWHMHHARVGLKPVRPSRSLEVVLADGDAADTRRRGLGSHRQRTRSVSAAYDAIFTATWAPMGSDVPWTLMRRVRTSDRRMGRTGADRTGLDRIAPLQNRVAPLEAGIGFQKPSLARSHEHMAAIGAPRERGGVCRRFP